MTAHLVTQGIVLRETETKEADKILTVFTRDAGKISVIARGARRKSCRFAACAQLLAYSELTLYQRKDWYYLDEGSTVMLFEGLRRDLDRLALGSYFAELTDAVTGEEQAAPELLSLLLNALYALDRLGKPPLLVKGAFELRLMALAGYEPLADGCAYCGREEPEEAMLDIRQGVLHCKACGERGRGLSLPVPPPVLAAMRHALYGDPKRLYAFTLPEGALEQFAQVAEAFTAAQLERGFRTLDFFKSLQPVKETANGNF